MSVIGSNILAGASGQGGGYNLTKSLRFRSSASAYLSRTPSSTGNRRTFTISYWMKRGTLGTTQYLFAAGSGTTESTWFQAGAFDNNGTSFDSVNSGTWTSGGGSTASLFRDTASWYHMVWAFDTTQATASNRVKLWVNGVQQTFPSVSISQNADLAWNNAGVVHYIGSRIDSGPRQLFDGYLAEVYSIDGQALTPSSFGETSTTTGVWIPKKYTGTYGTNGFYLPFTDTTSTSTLGTDFSGNSNTWTVNNISLTSGSTYDSMTDVPTLTSATTANYPTINPLDYNSTYLTLSAANLQQTYGGVSAAAASRATMTLPTTGKFYWEVYLTTIGTNNTTIRAGICSPTTAISGNSIDGSATSYGQITNGQKRNNATDSTYGAGFSNGQTLQVLYDATAGSLYFGQNNNFANGSGSFNQTFSGATAAFTGLSGEFMPYFITYGGSDIAVNFGQRPFTYTPPTGFVALNTYNLPTPDIGATASTTANKYFDATLYTGTGSALSVTNSGSMQPDFIWVKSRTYGSSHGLVDSVRGLASGLNSNATSSQTTLTDSITSINSNGFSLGADSTTWFNYGGSYVAWQWRASNATAVTNTAGSITSTVSANTTAGFSIVTYTGTGANATVGHGLGVAPSMVIVKNRGVTDVWMVQHISLGATKYIILNRTDAEGTLTTAWNNTAPTSSVFSIGTLGDVNRSSNNYVAYCFAPVAGYSAFGSYTGNGSGTGDGPFIYTGFRPRFVMFKNSTQGSQWILLDTARNTYNLANAYLEPNTPDTENTANTVLDILSNGFKLRNTGGTDYNESANIYIYMAFAENPFKYSNAR